VNPDSPFPYYYQAENFLLWRGATNQARRVLERMPKTDDVSIHVDWFFLNVYERNYDAALEYLSELSPESFSTGTVFRPRSLLQGMASELKLDSELSRKYYEMSRITLEKELQKHDDDIRILSSLGLTYAGLGQKQKAIEFGRKAVELNPASKDPIGSIYCEIDLALIYTKTREYNLAFDRIEYLLSIPTTFSVELLSLDPRWDPLRTFPRYSQILTKYSNK
jgi:tetratricopeptide (TPR) repeat protein